MQMLGGGLALDLGVQNSDSLLRGFLLLGV